MKKSTSIDVPPFHKETGIKGGCGDLETKELSKNIAIGKIMLPLLILVLCLSLLAFTFAWFKEINAVETPPISLSSRYVTTIYFENFERDQLDADNKFIGQTGLGIIGTPTEGDAPYEARFLLSVRADDNTPVPLNIVLSIRSVTVKKALEDAVALNQEQIANNFSLKLYNPYTMQEEYTASERISDFILCIKYWGEIENVPFEYSGIAYNGAEFTFAIDMYGEVI